MESSIQPELIIPLDEPNQQEGLEQPHVLVTCSTGDDKIDPFLLSALNNPRDRLLLLKLDHELERFVNDSTKQRLDFPPMSSYQRLIVHRVAQYFLLDHAAVDVDNLKRAVVLFKSPQSRVPVLRLTDLREEPDAPPQKAVKIMRRAANTSGRNNASGSGGSGDRAQTDKTLEERESEYAKARARIFNESASTTSSEKQTTNSSNNSSTNNGSSDSNVTTTSTDEDTPITTTIGDTNNTNNATSTFNTKDEFNTNASSQKRSAASNAKSRRGFPHDNAETSMRKYPDAGFSDMSFYSQDIASYRDKVTYNPKDQTLSLNDGGFMMDGKTPYHMGHFDPDGLFAGNIDSYMTGHPLRFDGYDFSDYTGTQEVPNVWGMPPLPHPHPGFYSGFGGARGGGYAGEGVMGKGDNSFYFDFAPPAKEWTPSSMGGLSMNSPLSANATPFEPASHAQAHAANPTTLPNPTSIPSPNSVPSPPSSSTINTFNTINTYNTINNISTINIINNNNSTKSTTPASSSPSSSVVISPPGARGSNNPPSASPPLSSTTSPPVPPSTSPTLPGATPSSSNPPPSTNMSSRIPISYKASLMPSSTSSKPSTSPSNPPLSSSTPTSTSAPPPTSPTSTDRNTKNIPSSTRSTTSPPSPPSSAVTSLPPHPRDSLSPPKFTSSSTTPPFPRTTTPPLPSSQVPSAQLPPPTQIPMQPPPIYRSFPPTPSQFGFDAGPWGAPPPHPYAPFPPTAQYHPLAQPPPHPLTHPHLYPPHPQFLPSQPGSFANAALYGHPFMGPSPVQKPIASLDYERRPPKSTELFDPKAPPAPKRHPPSAQVETGMRNMSLYPSPTSPAQTHATNQGVKKPPSVKSQSPQLPHTSQIPTKNPPHTSPPSQPLHVKPPNSTQARAPSSSSLSSAPSSSSAKNASLPPSVPLSISSSLNPPLSQDQVAPRLLYDYPQQQGVYVPPDHTPPPAVAHILEIYDFSSSTPVSPSSTFLEHPIFGELKKAGASIKVLDSSVFVAIFRNGAAARKALENWESESAGGKTCGYSLRQWAPAFISGSLSQPVPEKESDM